MNKGISKCIEVYKKSLSEGDIQYAYKVLTKYVGELKAKFPKEYQTGNLSFGYLDYTYFPFFNDYLRESKLRFGVVLNHEKMQFELWLMGQNADIQAKYWNALKDTVWNKGIAKMPQYSVLEVVLENKVNFDDKEEMTQVIICNAINHATEIEAFLKRK